MTVVYPIHGILGAGKRRSRGIDAVLDLNFWPRLCRISPDAN